jgi:hypothetical protein
MLLSRHDAEDIRVSGLATKVLVWSHLSTDPDLETADCSPTQAARHSTLRPQVDEHYPPGFPRRTSSAASASAHQYDTRRGLTRWCCRARHRPGVTKHRVLALATTWQSNSVNSLFAGSMVTCCGSARTLPYVVSRDTKEESVGNGFIGNAIELWSNL